MTLAEMLAEFRRAVGTLSTTRDPALYFRAHDTAQPWRESVESGYEGFHVMLDSAELGDGFGVDGQRNFVARVVVELGHPPFDSEADREGYMARDVERLVDLLEARVWPGDIDAVFFEGPFTFDRGNPQWWISTTTFRVSLWGTPARS